MTSWKTGGWAELRPPTTPCCCGLLAPLTLPPWTIFFGGLSKERFITLPWLIPLRNSKNASVWQWPWWHHKFWRKSGGTWPAAFRRRSMSRVDISKTWSFEIYCFNVKYWIKSHFRNVCFCFAFIYSFHWTLFFYINQVSIHHYSLHFASFFKKCLIQKILMLLKNYDSCSYKILHIKLP